MNHWGRIFFTYDGDGKLAGLQGQPLPNHVGNTRKILEQFKDEYFTESTREKLFEAAHLHDDGKKETFRIIDHHEKEKDRGGAAGGERFGYSFAGHRFRVPGRDAYIDGLIRSHHEFSVEQINREKAKLSEPERSHFADDLYLLCMADQLEAELSVKTVEQKQGDITRTFMEFVTRRIEEGPFTYTVCPWPFGPGQFQLEVALQRPVLDHLPRLKRPQIENAFKQGRHFEPQTITITLRRE